MRGDEQKLKICIILTQMGENWAVKLVPVQAAVFAERCILVWLVREATGPCLDQEQNSV